jgi:hypothetical protein
MHSSVYGMLTALGFGGIALVASLIGADNTVMTLIGTLAGYVLGAAHK